MSEEKEKVHDYFVGSGWVQDVTQTIVSICIDEEGWHSTPTVKLHDGRKVKYFIVGKRREVNKTTHASHYVAKDIKVRGDKQDDGQGKD